MGASKTDHFSPEQVEMSAIIKALGHPARLAILEHLLKVDSCVCGDIVDVIPLSQPTISQHLKELKTVGLIKGTVEGNSVCYCLNENIIEKLFTFIENIKSTLVAKSSCC
jgi:ArsR family transcriptional regulator, arsenate/arsenite/antimonite-responsive transcriptional repressor